MSTIQESDQIVQRRANLDALKQLGVDVYPHKFETSATISAIVAEHGAATGEALDANHVPVTVAGRILGVRTFGKANFLVLSDGLSRLQVYIRQDSVPERAFQIFKLLDFGDWVGVSGHLFRTRTGEFTIHAASLEFLAKCLLPLPEKWHGLQDVEIRYRQRYLDLIVNPESRRVFEIRSRVVAAIREFRRRLPELRNEYADEFPRFASKKFWREVYGMPAPQPAPVQAAPAVTVTSEEPALQRAGAGAAH